MATAYASPALDGSRTTKKVAPHQPQAQRASLKKDSRYARAHNNDNGPPEPPAPSTARRAERQSLRPPHLKATLQPAATTTAETPMKTKRPAQDSASTVHGRTGNGGRSFAVSNIGNGGRIYLRYIHLSILRRMRTPHPGRWDAL